MFLVALGVVFTLHAYRLAEHTFNWEVTSLSGNMAVGGAILAASVATGLYYRSATVRRFVTFCTPSLVVFPMAFLFLSPVSKLVVKGNVVALPPQNTAASFPIVMVVFDEFPLAALMDEHYQIDAILYPNFANFANEATWGFAMLQL